MLKAESELPTVSRIQLSEEQQKDEVVAPLYRAVLAGNRSNRKVWSELGKM